MKEIYLDVAATTKPKQEVIDAMIPYLIDKWYNPSSLYSPATKIGRDIKKARQTVGDFIGAKGEEIYFCSCGSEANCFAIQGFVNECLSHNKKPIVITSVIEHKSILECIKNLHNTDVYYVDVNSIGLIDLVMLCDLLKDVSHRIKSQTANVLVSIQYSNNEVGTTQHIKDIANLVHKYGGVFHTDAVQSFGQMDINVKKLNIDMMTVSGHKIGAPKGVGFLYKKSGVNIKPLIYGSQMDSMRGGTENVPYVIGMAKAVEILDIDNKIAVANVSDYMIEKLVNKFGCKLNGAEIGRLPNNINVTFPQNITGEGLLYILDMSKIRASTSSACNSKEIKPSQVLKAIGLTDDEAMRTVRFTLSEDITYQDVDTVIEEIDKAIKVISL